MPDEIQRIHIESTVLDERRDVLLRLPRDYDGARALPVLYILDGEEHVAHTSASVDFLFKYRRVPQLIVVGVVNDTNRWRDLTPTVVEHPLGAPTDPPPTTGGADTFLQFIERELVPEIERRCNTLPYRVLTGHSLGGLVAIRALITRPRLFDTIVAVSPALQWDDQIVPRQFEDFLKQHRDLRNCLYLTMANERGELRESFERFRDILQRHACESLEWECKQLAEEDHYTGVMPSHYLALRRAFRAWHMSPDPKTGRYFDDLARIDDYYERASRKFGHRMTAPDWLLANIALQLQADGKIPRALEMLEVNVVRHPESHFAHEWLATAYEHLQRFDSARRQYEKALEASRTSADPSLTAAYERRLAELDRSMDRAAREHADRRS